MRPLTKFKSARMAEAAAMVSLQKVIEEGLGQNHWEISNAFDRVTRSQKRFKNEARRVLTSIICPWTE